MLEFTLDPTMEGLNKIHSEYEELALQTLWNLGEEGANSRKVWDTVCNNLSEGNSISRASIIFFLNRMVEQGVLSFRDATGKGGHQKIYYPILDRQEYITQIAKTCIQSMLKDFPELSDTIQKYL